MHFNKQSLSSAALFCHSTVKARLRLVAVVQPAERMLCSHQQALNAGPERCTRAQLHAGRRAPKVCTCRRNDLQPGLPHSLTRSLTGAVPCLIWTRHAEVSLSPDNCSFLHKNISLPHISEFTFQLLNQVVGGPGGVARGASTAQLARSGRRTHNEEAQRDTSDRPALWLPWAIDVVAFRVFPQSQISACFLS